MVASMRRGWSALTICDQGSHRRPRGFEIESGLDIAVSPLKVER
jgi:hypothetical protein